MGKKFSRWVIAIVLLYTSVNIYYITTLQFNYDFESFFPYEDEDLYFFKSFTEKFEGDNDYLLIGLENDKTLFDSTFLKKVDLFTKDLKKLEHVDRITGPSTLKNVLLTPAGPIEVPFIHTSDPSRYKTDSTLIYSYKDLIGTFFSEDAKACLVYVKMESMLRKSAADSMVYIIDDLVNSYDFHIVHIAGRSKAEVVYVEKMKWELAVFVSSSVVLLILFLYLSFRSAWGVILPLIIVLLSIIAVLGLMGMTNKPIDLMTVLLPTIMFVVGMSDVVHIITKYLEELRLGSNKLKAIRTTIKEVGLATLLTSVTTGIGFLTLLTAGIKPIQDFGLYTSAGVFLAFILAFSFLPAMLVNLPKPKIADKKINTLFWYNQLHPMFGWVVKQRKAILLGSVVVIGISFYGISKVEVNSLLIDEVSDGDPLKEDFLFFERKFSGVRPFEVAVEVSKPNADVFDHEVLHEIEKLQVYLENTMKVGQIVSPVTIVRTLHRASNGGLPDYFSVPEEKSEYHKIKRIVKKMAGAPEFKAIIADDNVTTRISGKMEDYGSKRVAEQLEELKVFAAQSIDPNIIKYRVTGSALLIDKNNNYLSQNMLQGLGIAFIAIALIMGLLYRSFSIVLIALIPNVIPLLMIGAIIGYFDIGLKMSTSIIFTIAFGIAVDDTIHFMSKLHIEMAKGKSVLYALKRTFISTGKAIIVTSIILIAGFLTLMISSFNGTFYTGLLVSLTLCFAVFADLLLIPPLTIFLYKAKNKKNDKKIIADNPQPVLSNLN